MTFGSRFRYHILTESIGDFEKLRSFRKLSYKWFFENQKEEGVMLTYQMVVSSLPVVTVIAGLVLLLGLFPFSRRGRR